MATHSTLLAWGIPWAEKPGGLQSWGRKELDTTEHACIIICDDDYDSYR